MEKQLPKNWVETKPLQISKIIRGVSYGKTDAFQHEFDNSCLILRGGNIQDGYIVEGKDNVYVSLYLIKKEQFIKKHDVVIVGSTGSTNLIGKAATALFDSTKISFGAFLMNIRAYEPINKRYFSYYFQTNFYRDAIRNLAGGVNINNIRKEYIENLYFPLPPLSEQNRIVTKLDTLFAKLETIKSSMATVPLLLKDFRQQVLTQAVTGKLTEEWRKGKRLDDSDKLFEKIYSFKKKWAEIESIKGNSEAKRLLSKMKQTSSIKSDDIPNTWGYFSLLDINHLVVDCHNKTAPYKDDGIYLIRTTNIKNGKIVLNDIRYVSDETYKFWSKRCIPNSGDILFTREAPMGEVAIIPEKMKICLGQRTMLIRTIPSLLENKYVLYCLLSNKMSIQINEKAIGTGVKHLRVGDVENLIIPIPSSIEQQEIVSRVESLLAKADAIEKQYESLKAKIDNLPQALLHKAFKGELTVQLDSDGDARELLKEIGALKAITEKGKKGGKVVKGYEEKVEDLGMVAEANEELQPKVVKLKPTNTEIYKRTLLAAEIVYQLKETNTLGHLKLQKMLYLCQETGSMNLPMNFLKQAMGPYDNQLARSLDKQFFIKKWFEYQREAPLKYKPLENCGKHKEDFEKYFENEIEQINYLIKKFTKFTSNQIEAVATLYACWKEAIDKKEMITDKLIITKFYQWSKEKEKFREDNLVKALDWMRRNGVEPRE